MVRNGLGISVLFLWNIEVESQKSRFVVIQTEAPPLVSRISLIRRKNTFTSHAVTEFVELARTAEWKHLRPVTSPFAAARGIVEI